MKPRRAHRRRREWAATAGRTRQGLRGGWTRTKILRREVVMLVTPATLRLAVLLAAAAAVPAQADPLVPRWFAAADRAQGKVFVIVEDGRAVWEYDAPHTRDLAVLPGGNILFTTGHGVLEVTPEKDVVFRFDSENEIDACQRLPEGRTLVGDSTAGRLLEVDAAGAVVKEVRLLAEGEEGGHAYLGHARRLDDGHYLVALSRDQRVREYDAAGVVVWDAPAPGGAHGIARLANGHTLVATGDRDAHEPRLVEYDTRGRVVWEVTNDDLPGRPLRVLAAVQRLASGNTVVSNGRDRGGAPTPVLLEITPQKQIAWTYARRDVLRAASAVVVLTDAGPRGSSTDLDLE
jgi:hypothetical protein